MQLPQKQNQPKTAVIRHYFRTLLHKTIHQSKKQSSQSVSINHRRGLDSAKLTIPGQ
jgi:hypothetical protein